MTREEAAETIYGVIIGADECEEDFCLFSDQIEALEMGIEALKQPEIIRCTDCKYAKSVDSERWIRCDLSGRYELRTWYCGSARRREE